MNIEIGDKKIDFVFQGDELIYPAYIKDGLVLHYDFAGMGNNDVTRGIARDLSGNGNDGVLENFAYDEGSGYDSNSYLEFDNVDDFITIPELNLDVNNFTVAVDGEVLSYRGDNVAKINENGLKIGGRNYLPNFHNSIWGIGSGVIVDDYSIHFPANSGNPVAVIILDVESNTNYTCTFNSDYTRYYIYEYNSGTGDVIVVSNLPEVTFKTGSLNKIRLLIDTWSVDRDKDRNVWDIKLEKGNKATDWSPAPEDLQTTKITPIFSNKIKTLMYWNRALTDTELQEVYNVQKHRI